jgi:uncharacterized membrane protein
MSGPPPVEDRFADRVMDRVARQERRLPAVVAALCAAALVLAVPALLVLVARPGLEALVDLSLAAAAEVIGGLLDNPVFWTAVGLGVVWLVWLASVAVRGRR